MSSPVMAATNRRASPDDFAHMDEDPTVLWYAKIEPSGFYVLNAWAARRKLRGSIVTLAGRSERYHGLYRY